MLLSTKGKGINDGTSYALTGSSHQFSEAMVHLLHFLLQCREMV